MGNSNNLLEISSKYTSYQSEKFRLCAIVIASECLPHTVSGQWHSPDPVETLAHVCASRDVTALKLHSGS